MVLKLIQPYTRIRIAFVAQQLNVDERDVEQLLVSLILDGRIQGHIDQVCTNTFPEVPSFLLWERRRQIVLLVWLLS